MCGCMISGSEMVAGIPLWLVLSTGGVSLACHWLVVPMNAERHHRATTCRQCKYGLDGLSQVVRCPECGLQDARRRTEVERTMYRFAMTWQRPIAFGVLAGFIVLAGLVRLLIVEGAMMQRYSFPIRSQFSRHFLDGWPVAPTVLAGILVWCMGRRKGPGGSRLIARAAVCGAAVLAGVAWVTAYDPFVGEAEQHSQATLLSYAVLMAAASVSGFVVMATGCARRWCWRGLQRARVGLNGVDDVVGMASV